MQQEDLQSTSTYYIVVPARKQAGVSRISSLLAAQQKSFPYREALLVGLVLKMV